MNMKQEDFKKRYIIKLLSSILIAALNMVIQMLLPRIFSVEEYGYYSYNLNVFTSIVVIANLSTSNALISKYSKRNDEIGIVVFYLKFVACVSLVLNVIITILYSFRFFRDIFAGQSLIIILLGLEVSIVTKLLTDCVSMYDASAISRFPALIQICIKVFVSFIVIIGYFWGRYNLMYFYCTQLLSISSAIVVLLLSLLSDSRRKNKTRKKTTVEYIKEFWLFCRPLIVAIAFSQLVIIIMNWALMKWSGASQQALFGVAWQINALISYVFSPYAELSKREFAVLSEDRRGLGLRFEQSFRIIIWLTSFFAIFIAFLSDSIVPLLFGEKYNQAALITGIIMYYTIFQSIGQLTGSYLISVEKTKANALISIVGQVATLAFVFLFQIPNFIWPNSLGSVGIALNYLIGNIITFAISVLYISQDLNVGKVKLLLVPFYPMIILSSVAIILRELTYRVIPGTSILQLLLKIGVSGLLYSFLTAVVLLFKPKLIGVSRETIFAVFKRG